MTNYFVEQAKIRGKDMVRLCGIAMGHIMKIKRYAENMNHCELGCDIPDFNNHIKKTIRLIDQFVYPIIDFATDMESIVSGNLSLIEFFNELNDVIELKLGSDLNSEKSLKRQSDIIQATNVTEQPIIKNSLAIIKPEPLNQSELKQNEPIVQLKVEEIQPEHIVDVASIPLPPLFTHTYDYSDKYPEMEKLPFRTELNCYISHVIDPSSFYIIYKEDMTVLKKVSKFMNNYYNGMLPPYQNKAEFKSGCINRFAVCFKNTWYRAILTNIMNESEAHIQIHLVDYGPTMIVSACSIFLLDDVLLNYPPFAYHSKLHMIEPIYGEWSIEAKNLMHQHSMTLCAVIIEDCVNDKLSLIVHTDDDKILHMEFVLLNMANFNTAHLNKVKRDEGDDIVSTDVDIILGGSKAKDNRIICKNYLGPPHTTCFKGNRCNHLHVLPNPEGYTVEQINIESVPQISLPELDCWLDVVVTHVVSHNLFYIQIIWIHYENFDAVVSEFESDIKQFCQMAAIHSHLKSVNADKRVDCDVYPAIGEYVAVWNDAKSCWSRAMIVDVHQDFAKVFLIDFGATIQVIYDKIQRLPNNCMSFPRQAFLCSLSNVKGAIPNRENDAKMFLSDLCTDKLFIAKIEYYDDDIAEINLRNMEGENISEIMAAKNYVSLIKV